MQNTQEQRGRIASCQSQLGVYCDFHNKNCEYSIFLFRCRMLSRLCLAWHHLSLSMFLSCVLRKKRKQQDEYNQQKRQGRQWSGCPRNVQKRGRSTSLSFSFKRCIRPFEIWQPVSHLYESPCSSSAVGSRNQVRFCTSPLQLSSVILYLCSSALLSCSSIALWQGCYCLL